MSAQTRVLSPLVVFSAPASRSSTSGSWSFLQSGGSEIVGLADREPPSPLVRLGDGAQAGWEGARRCPSAGGT